MIILHSSSCSTTPSAITLKLSDNTAVQRAPRRAQHYKYFQVHQFSSPLSEWEWMKLRMRSPIDPALAYLDKVFFAILGVEMKDWISLCVLNTTDLCMHWQLS